MHRTHAPTGDGQLVRLPKNRAVAGLWKLALPTAATSPQRLADLIDPAGLHFLPAARNCGRVLGPLQQDEVCGSSVEEALQRLIRGAVAYDDLQNLE